MVDIIEKAVALLQAGELVALPTETVYGLAALADNDDAIQKIFTLKQRPTSHPLIVHIADVESLAAWAQIIPQSAYQLAEIFWPGPLTLVLKKMRSVSDKISGGQTTVALRCPAHPLTLAILRQLKNGICAPSANRFGQLSPTTAMHVRAIFGDKIPLIVDGGACRIGIESTIVDLTGELPRILRAGMLSEAALQKVVGPIESVFTSTLELPRVSGNYLQHYAPKTPLYLGDKNSVIEHLQPGIACALLLLEDDNQFDHFNIKKYIMTRDPDYYAQQLYAVLHQIDDASFEKIVVEMPPEHDMRWQGIRDRLQRAAEKTHQFSAITSEKI